MPSHVPDVSEFDEGKEEHFKEPKCQIQLAPDVTNLWLIHSVDLSFPAHGWPLERNICLALWVFVVHSIILGLIFFLMSTFESKGMPGGRRVDPEDVVKFTVVLEAESYTLSERIIGARCTAFGNIFVRRQRFHTF